MTKGQEGIQTHLMVLILSKATVHEREECVGLIGKGFMEVRLDVDL